MNDSCSFTMAPLQHDTIKLCTSSWDCCNEGRLVLRKVDAQAIPPHANSGCALFAVIAFKLIKENCNNLLLEAAVCVDFCQQHRADEKR